MTDTNTDKMGDSPVLAPDSFILSASTVEELLIDRIEPADAPIFIPNKDIPNAFISGLAYTASWGAGPNINPEQLENIPVGIQDAAIAVGSIRIEASAEGTLQAVTDNNSNDSNNNNKAIEEDSEAYQIAKKLQKNIPLSARAIAKEQERKRVSRRLLLAERSKKLTVTCPITGIVSLIEVPAVPFPAKNPQLAKALIWTSPFADIDNCRGIAQQGIDYLRRLDTQVLAGVLIVLSDHYELFKSQPFDTGAQKNAILRTAGKDYLIDAIIMIEALVHSNNHRFLPKLSLIFDSNLEEFGFAVRMQSYLKQLAEAIAKPDKDAWDDKKIKPMYPIRPVYVKDIKNAEKKISFLARQEQARAKKEFVEDKKAGKIALALLSKQAVVNDKLRGLLSGALSEDGLLVYPQMIIDKLIDVLGTRFAENANARQLIAILKKDRKALMLSIEELEEDYKENLVESEEDTDSEAPGNEEAIEEQSNAEELILDNADALLDTDTESEELDTDSTDQEILSDASSDIKKDSPTPAIEAPKGLTAWEKLLWKKKMAKATAAPKTFVQNTSIPSTAVYVPISEEKAVVTVESYSYSTNRLYIVGNLSNNRHVYFITNDQGTLIPVKYFIEWDMPRSYE